MLKESTSSSVDNNVSLHRPASSMAMVSRQKIFIAEDDPSIQEIFTIVLSRAGFDVEISPDGRSIFGRFHQWPSLFILDKHLSGLNGLDVCRYLKSKATTRHIPVIMISATPGIESLAKEAGAEDSIQKPFSVTLLLEKINQHISRAGYF